MTRIPYKSCPLCGGDSEKLLTIDCRQHRLHIPALGDTMTWMKCGSCGHVHADGYFPDDSPLFSRMQEDQRVGADVPRYRGIWARVIERVSQYAKPGGWTDIGFGNAALILMVDEWGYSPCGVDIRPYSVKELRELGVPAFTGMNEVPRLQSVISMSDVLEHVPYPKEMLRQAHDALAPDGVIFVSCPNYDCNSWKAWKGTNPYWFELEHYHNFSKKRLYALLEECGFEPISYGVSERYILGMEVIARKIV